MPNSSSAAGLELAAPVPLPEAVYRELRTAILNGVYRPGQILRQEELAQQLGVSRAPLREALPRLEAEGIVVLRPRRGYSVVSLKADEITEIFELRGLIEEKATFIATQKRTAEDIARVRDLRERMRRADVGTPAGLGQWFELHYEFHDCLLAPSGRRHFRRMVESLRAVVEPYLRVEIGLTGDVRQAEEEHDGLVDAFAAGDAARMALLTAEHVRHTADRLLRGLADGAAGARTA